MGIVFAVAAFATGVFFHGIAMRIPLRIDTVRRFLVVGVPIGVAVVAWEFATYGYSVSSFAAILLYAFLCELYMFVFTLVLSSVSVAMLERLRAGRGGELEPGPEQDPKEMVALRLERLIGNAFVERVGDRLRVTNRGLRLHLYFAALKRFFHHRV